MEKDDSDKSTDELVDEYTRIMDLTDRAENARGCAICGLAAGARTYDIEMALLSTDAAVRDGDGNDREPATVEYRLADVVAAPVA